MASYHPIWFLSGMSIGLLLLALPGSGQQNPTGFVLPDTAKVQDKMTLPEPKATQMSSLLGQRFKSSAANRLPMVEEEELLAGFRNRPGKQAWIGEHVGKWLHAASLTYAVTGDPKLREK